MMTSFASLLLAASAIALTPQIAMARQAGAPAAPAAPPTAPAAPDSSAAPIVPIAPIAPIAPDIRLHLEHNLLLQEKQLERQMEVLERQFERKDFQERIINTWDS